MTLVVLVVALDACAGLSLCLQQQPQQPQPENWRMMQHARGKGRERKPQMLRWGVHGDRGVPRRRSCSCCWCPGMLLVLLRYCYCCMPTN